MIGLRKTLAPNLFTREDVFNIFRLLFVSTHIKQQRPNPVQANGVKNDWRKMKCPPLEMFHWNRIVVDEFTYLKLRSKAAVHMGLSSKYRWSLSGTPPISHFSDVKSIAASMGINLGVHDGKIDTKKLANLCKKFNLEIIFNNMLL